MKKIVLISPAYPYRGGIASSTERLAYEFQKEGHEVIIYTFTLQYPNFLFPGKTQYTDDPAPKGLNIIRSISAVNPITWMSTGKAIRNLNPDIVICRFWMPFFGPSLGTILRQIRKNNKTKCIPIVDNIIPHEQRPGDKQLSSYFVKANDAFIVMSKSVGEEIRTFTQEKKVRLVEHPIYDNYGDAVDRNVALKKLELDNEKYLLFFGFIREYKGLDLLLKAMADPRIIGMGIKLIVAGEFYGNEDFYYKIIEDNEIADSLVMHTKFISNDDVKYYFSVADLVVQPYKSATQSGISQLAYHFDQPMVATRVGGLPEIIDHGKGGYIVDVDPTSIADSIVDFYENQNRATFVDHVKKVKHRFSWSNLVNAILELAQ